MSIVASIVLLGIIGAIGAFALRLVATKFYVEEDERVALIEEVLPGANCGACGCKGCHDFAVTCLKNNSLENMNCPGAGEEGMLKVGEILGVSVSQSVKMIAEVKCNGTEATKTRLSVRYSGPSVCSIMNFTAGDYACQNSCLGCGDCERSCPWDAIHILSDNSLPLVSPERCTGCGKCVEACPRDIIEVRPVRPNGRRVWIACSNCQKGPVVHKQCTVGCIACGKCVKECPFEAIMIVNNLARINFEKCKACGKCVSGCPVNAIHCNFDLPKRKEKEA